MATHSDAQHGLTHCPYLGVEASNHRLGEAVEYPSFENRCWTSQRPIPLLLTDQATLCLCNAYLQCPRFIAARAARQGQERPVTLPPPADADSITTALNELEADVEATTNAQSQSRRRWGWIGAGLIFMSSLLCGGLFAAYVGWQMVRDEIASTPPGEINTLASPAQAQTDNQPQTFFIVTATSTPGGPIVAQSPAQNGDVSSNNIPSESVAQYPEAIQPTPIANGSQANQPPPSLSQIAQETNSTPVAPALGPTPILDFGLEVPTRRPTPFLDIPTSTPIVDGTPTLDPTPTPQPPLGTPVVIFYADDKTMEPGDCTTVHWHVENVKAVYYENLGVDGRGEKDECVRDDPGDYNLMVILANGATEVYTVTVGVVAPTNTPEPTPTRTQQPLPTATWTPSIPTSTPTPATTYLGTRLQANGDPIMVCARGETCEMDFYVSNAGNAIDNITLSFTEAGKWPRQLCRFDGICSENQITLVDMGLSNTGVVRLLITIPQDAELQTMAYQLQAVSEKSGGKTTSNSVRVEITATNE